MEISLGDPSHKANIPIFITNEDIFFLSPQFFFSEQMEIKQTLTQSRVYWIEKP